MRSDKVQLLSAIESYCAQKIVSDDWVHRTNFLNLFSEAAKFINLQWAEMARAIGVSQPTVRRWFNRDSAPVAVGRGPALKALNTLITNAPLSVYLIEDGIRQYGLFSNLGFAQSVYITLNGREAYWYYGDFKKSGDLVAWYGTFLIHKYFIESQD